jgi:hypothetical protein
MSVRYQQKVFAGYLGMILAAGYTLLVGWFAVYFDIFPPIFHQYWSSIFHFYVLIIFLLGLYYAYTKDISQMLVQTIGSAAVGGTVYTLILRWFEGEFFSTWWQITFTVYISILAFVGLYFGVLKSGGSCCGDRRDVENDKAK